MSVSVSPGELVSVDSTRHHNTQCDKPCAFILPSSQLFILEPVRSGKILLLLCAPGCTDIICRLRLIETAFILAL
jgi:hypothetical protein